MYQITVRYWNIETFIFLKIFIVTNTMLRTLFLIIKSKYNIMNITQRVIDYIEDPKIYSIIEDNKEIQFYAYGEKIYWRDSRFRKSMDEHQNTPANNMEEMYEIFSNHINTLTEEFLEKTKDKLIQKYIGEFKKPEIYFQELKYLNAELSALSCS